MAKKGETIPIEVRIKIGNANRGKHPSQEARDKMREAGLKRRHTEEEKRKISESNRGKIMSLESRVKMSIAKKGTIRTLEARQKQSISTRGIKKTEEHKRKIQESRKRYYQNHPEEWERERRKLADYQATLTPEERKARSLKGRLACLEHVKHRKPTRIEQAIARELDLLGLPYQQQVIIGNKYVVDFLITNTNVVVECDGDYWHSLEWNKVKDTRKDLWMQENGYQILRLTEKEIKADAERCALRVVSYVVGAMN